MRSGVFHRAARLVAALAVALSLVAVATPAAAATNNLRLYTSAPGFGTFGKLVATGTWGPGCTTINVDGYVEDFRATGGARYTVGWAYVHRCNGSYSWELLGRTDDYDRTWVFNKDFVATGLVVYVCITPPWGEPLHNEACSNSDYDPTFATA